MLEFMGGKYVVEVVIPRRIERAFPIERRYEGGCFPCFGIVGTQNKRSSRTVGNRRTEQRQRPLAESRHPYLKDYYAGIRGTSDAICREVRFCSCSAARIRHPENAETHLREIYCSCISKTVPFIFCLGFPGRHRRLRTGRTPSDRFRIPRGRDTFKSFD